jgi:hypothetical protein
MASPGFPAYSPLEFTGAPTYIPVGQSMQGYKPDYEPLQSTMSPATFAKKYPLANQIMFGKPKKPAKKPSPALKEKQAKLSKFDPYAYKYTDEQLIDETLAFFEKRYPKK